jgi:hypothetical protein
MSYPSKVTCVAIGFLAVAIVGARYWHGQPAQAFCLVDNGACAPPSNFDFYAITAIR